MTMLILAISFFSFIFSFSEKIEDHAIYVSVIELKEIEGGGRLSVKVFYDDLEAAIQNSTGLALDLSDVFNCRGYSSDITDYFRSHLTLKINNEDIRYEFSQCEKNGDSIWLEYEFYTNQQWQYLNLENDHFMELFPTQTNVFSVEPTQGKKMFKLTKSESTYELNF